MTEPTQDTPAARPTLVRRLLNVRPADLVILFFLCVLAGLVLAVLNVDPAALWVNFFGAVADAWITFFDQLGTWLRWALQYFFLGAVIVLPIWLVVHVLRSLSRR